MDIFPQEYWERDNVLTLPGFVGMSFPPKTARLILIASPDAGFPSMFFSGIADGIVVGNAFAADFSSSKGVVYQNGVVTLIASPDADFPSMSFSGIADGIVVGDAFAADGSSSKGVVYVF